MSNKSDYGVQRNVLKVIIRDEEFGLNEAQIRKVPGNRFLHLLLTHERVKATKKMWVDRRPEVFPFIQEYLSGREPFPITEEMAIYHGMFRGQLLKYLVEDAEFYNLTELALKAKIELLKIELEQATKVNVPAIIDKTLVDLQIKRMAHKIELKQIEIDFALKKEEFKIAAEKLNLEGQKAVQKAQAEIHRSANLIKVLDKQKEGVIVLPLSPNSNVYFCTNNQASHQDEHVAPTAEPETLPIPQETPTAEIERRILSALTLPTAADPGTHLKPAPETTLLAGGLQPINPDEVFTPPVTTSGKHQKLKPTKKKLPRAPLKGSVVPSNDIAGPTSGPDANLPGREGQVKKVSEEKHVTIVPKESTKGKKATKAISIAQAKDVADNHKVGAAPQPVKHNALKSQIQPFNNFGTVDESILPVKPVPGGEDTNKQTQTSVPKPTSVDGENLLRSPSVSPPRLTWAEKGKGRARDRSSGSKESESINKQMEAFFNRPIDLGEGTSTQGVKATLPVDADDNIKIYDETLRAFAKPQAPQPETSGKEPTQKLGEEAVQEKRPVEALASKGEQPRQGQQDQQRQDGGKEYRYEGGRSAFYQISEKDLEVAEQIVAYTQRYLAQGDADNYKAVIQQLANHLRDYRCGHARGIVEGILNRIEADFVM